MKKNNKVLNLLVEFQSIFTPMELTEKDLRPGNYIEFNYRNARTSFWLTGIIKEVRRLQVQIISDAWYTYDMIRPIPFDAAQDLPSFGFKASQAHKIPKEIKTPFPKFLPGPYRHHADARAAKSS